MPPLVLMFKGCFRSVAVMFAGALGAALALPATAGENAATDPGTLFVRAAHEDAIGTARKTKPVDARPAKAGEVIVTVIKGEGTETRSKPAVAGDMVVRNRCPATGNEQYLVTAAKFKERYGEPLGPADPEGWRPYRPHGAEMLYVLVRPDDGSFTFTAPWGEAMVARPGDALVRDPADPKDTYRVAAASFSCTYDIIKPAK